MLKRLSLLLMLLCLVVCHAGAQGIFGVVTDAVSGEAMPGVNIFFQNDMKVVAVTDVNGKYRLEARKGNLVFSSIGYDSQVISVKGSQRLDVKLVESASELATVVVEQKRQRYTRKDNPAVELMQRVVEAGKQGNLHQKDFFSYAKYEKLTGSFNEFTEKVFEDDHFKHLSFLKDHVEVCPETGKLILPLTVEEKISRRIFRRTPEQEKEIVQGKRSEGVMDFFASGDLVNGLLGDFFTDVDIQEDKVRLLQHHFISPMGSQAALRFYRYFITDTLLVSGRECYQVDFTPNNPQDVGFSGSLFIRADSTLRLQRAVLGIPTQSVLNFIDQMDIYQDFDTLPDGTLVPVRSKMQVQVKVVSAVQSMMVERDVVYSDYDLSPVPETEFDFIGNVQVLPSAYMRDDAFWTEHRPHVLSQGERSMGSLLDKIKQIKGFKYVLWVAKAFVENFIETNTNSDKPSKVDIGPVNAMVGSNWVEGFHLRAGAQTTAALHKHLFAKGYVKYGFKDNRWKGSGELTYSFNEKDYLPREYPVHNITFTYANDIMSPSDKFLHMDKDNVFVAWKWTPVRHMHYYERFNLLYDREWENGLRMNVQLRRERDRGVGDLFYQPLSTGVPNADGILMPTQDATQHLRDITFTEATLGLRFQPGTTYVNTKQNRKPTNKEAPVFEINHTVGVKGILGSQYNYNFTEVSFYKRVWLRSWGDIDCRAKAGVQWNQVPYPFLIMPAANLSYILEEDNFSLINNMEFLNDRYASFNASWNLQGKILNKIPLISRLKWREHIGFNALWGTLSDKNNPYLPQNQGSEVLFFFPGSFDETGQFTYTSHVMDRRRPYFEVSIGLHNIFKVFQIEYVHRLNYISPGTHRWGIRGRFHVSF